MRNSHYRSPDNLHYTHTLYFSPLGHNSHYHNHCYLPFFQKQYQDNIDRTGYRGDPADHALDAGECLRSLVGVGLFIVRITA